MLKKYWLIILIFFLLVGVFTLTLLTSYFAAYKSLGEEISNNTLPLTSDNIYSEIQKDLVLSIFISSLMAHDTFLWDWVLSGEKDPGRMIKYLAEIQKKYNTVTSFFVSENTKNYYHPKGILKKVSENEPQDEWYYRAKGLKDRYEINIDTDTADKTRATVFVNYQVHDYQNDLIGITGVGLELRKVQKILNTYQDKYKSKVFFVDKTGKVILHAEGFEYPLDLYQWEGFSGLALNLLTNPGTSFEYSTEGHVYYVSSRFVPEFNLALVILKEGDGLQNRLAEKLRTNLAISLLITIFIVAMVSFIIKRYNQKLEMLASVDTLTGAYNRNAFSLIFSQAIKEKKRKKTKLSLLMMDLDHFKSINDRYGHHYGDLVLKIFSETVLIKIRETDILCRWGGEEFVVLLLDCPVDKAVKVAENIRKVVSELEISFAKDTVSITLSAGVVEHREQEILSRLIARADSLMYQAKQQGRNRVVFEE